MLTEGLAGKTNEDQYLDLEKAQKKKITASRGSQLSRSTKY